MNNTPKDSTGKDIANGGNIVADDNIEKLKKVIGDQKIFEPIDTKEADQSTFPHERTQPRDGLERRCCLDVMDEPEMLDYLVRIKSIIGLPEPQYIIDWRDAELISKIKHNSQTAMKHRLLYAQVNQKKLKKKLEKKSKHHPTSQHQISCASKPTITQKVSYWLLKALTKGDPKYSQVDNTEQAKELGPFMLSSQWRLHENILPKVNEDLAKKHRDKVYNFDTLIRQVIFNFIDYVGELPASESHHHNWPGGLLRHSLEVAEIALKYAKSQDLKVTALNDIEVKRRSRWQYGAFIAGLLHDIGKPVTDMVIHCQLPDKSLVIWNPTIVSLHEFLKQNNSKRYFVDMNPIKKYGDGLGRFKHHETIGSIFISKILTPEAMNYITTSPDVGYGLMENLSRLLSGRDSDIYLKNALSSGEQISVHSSFKKIRSNFHLKDRTNSMAEALANHLHSIRNDQAFRKNLFQINGSTFLRFPEGLTYLSRSLSQSHPEYQTAVNMNFMSALDFFKNANYISSWENNVYVKHIQLTEPKYDKKKDATTFVPVGNKFQAIMMSHPTLVYGTDPIPASISAILTISENHAIEFFDEINCRDITFTREDKKQDIPTKPKTKSGKGITYMGNETYNDESELDVAVIHKPNTKTQARLIGKNDQSEESGKPPAEKETDEQQAEPITEPTIEEPQTETSSTDSETSETETESNQPVSEEELLTMAGKVTRTRVARNAPDPEEIDAQNLDAANAMFTSTPNDTPIGYDDLVKELSVWVSVNDHRMSGFKECLLALDELTQEEFERYSTGFHVKQTNENGILIKQSLFNDIKLALNNSSKKQVPPKTFKPSAIKASERNTETPKKKSKPIMQSSPELSDNELIVRFIAWATEAVTDSDDLSLNSFSLMTIKVVFADKHNVDIQRLFDLRLIEKKSNRTVKVIINHEQGQSDEKVDHEINTNSVDTPQSEKNLNSVDSFSVSSDSDQQRDHLDYQLSDSDGIDYHDYDMDINNMPYFETDELANTADHNYFDEYTESPAPESIETPTQVKPQIIDISEKTNTPKESEEHNKTEVDSQTVSIHELRISRQDIIERLELSYNASRFLMNLLQVFKFESFLKPTDKSESLSTHELTSAFKNYCDQYNLERTPDIDKTLERLSVEISKGKEHLTFTK